MANNWDSKYKWCFSPLGSGPKVGVNDAGIGIFKRQPYKGLAKEILQNVIDAWNEDLIDKPAKAHFQLIEINKDDLPGRERLSEVIKKCYEYYHDGDDGRKMAMLAKAAEEILDNSDKIRVLKISDYNTKGLEGSHKEKGTNWTGLVREIGATNKGNDKSGAFGVGKFAPFNFSSLRTIIYSTLDKNGETALQGKTMLTTFKDEDGKLKQNVGLFGKYDSGSDDCLAIYNMQDVPEVFRRVEVGTDLFVIGFKEEKDWKQQIAISVLEYFFYTIYMGKLEVTVEDSDRAICIKKDNLGELIDHYDNICREQEQEFSAPIFWKVLNDTSDKKKIYKTEILNKGEVELHLFMDQEFSEKRILEMRKPGMKIQEDSKFRVPINFYGIFIATGANSKSTDPKENINSFLRKCENQAHDAWSWEEYEENKDEAKIVLDKIHKWILEQVKKHIPDVSKKEVDAFGLNDFLPNQYEEGDDQQEESAFTEFEPLPIEVNEVKETPKNRTAADISVETKEKITEKIIEVEVTGDDAGTSDKPGNGNDPIPLPHGPNPGPNPEPVPGPDPGPIPGPFPSPEPAPGPGPEPAPGPFPGPNQGAGTNLVIVAEQTETIGEGNDNGKVEKLNKKVSLNKISLTTIKTPYDESQDIYKIIIVPKKSVKNAYIRLRIGSDDEDKHNANIKSAYCNGTNLTISDSLINGIDLEKDLKTTLLVKLNEDGRCLLEVSAYAK